MPKCLSCGDLFDVDTTAVAFYTANKPDKAALARKMQTHCIACAVELALGQLTPTTLQHGTGGGRRVIRDPRNMGG